MFDWVWFLLFGLFAGSVIALLFTLVKYLFEIKVFFECFCDVLRAGLKQKDVEVTGDE